VARGIGRGGVAGEAAITDELAGACELVNLDERAAEGDP
jgi:hypothetical protein